MKRKLFSIILTVAVLAEALAILTRPAFAWDWKDNGKFEVAEHIASVVDNGRELLASPLELNIWRAPTDNDRKIKLEWAKYGYPNAKHMCYGTEVMFNGANEVKVKRRNKQKSFLC